MKVDVNLQKWSALMGSICDRQTPYEDLTKLDQVTDRLALEKFEQLLDIADEGLKAQMLEIVSKRIQGL
jgi:hypothetical protein